MVIVPPKSKSELDIMAIVCGNEIWAYKQENYIRAFQMLINLPLHSLPAESGRRWPSRSARTGAAGTPRRTAARRVRSGADPDVPETDASIETVMTKSGGAMCGCAQVTWMLLDWGVVLVATIRSDGTPRLSPQTASATVNPPPASRWQLGRNPAAADERVSAETACEILHKTSDAVKLSSCLGDFLGGGGECGGFVVLAAGGQAVP